MKKLFVGGLEHDVTEDQLRTEFEAFGEVERCYIIKDKSTGESRGFGFCEMVDDQAADLAMLSLNGKTVNGRRIGVNLARPRD